MNIIPSLLSILLFLISQTVFAGGAPVSLECVSDSGRTQVSSTFPGDILGSKLTFVIDGEPIVYRDQYSEDLQYDESLTANSEFSIKDYSNSLGVSVLEISENENPEIFFELKSLKKGFKTIKTQFGKQKTFRATVIGVDPRESKNGAQSPKIYVNCSYVYEI